MQSLSVEFQHMVSTLPAEIAIDAAKNFGPLGIRSDFPLTEEQVEALFRIDDYDLSFLCDYLMKHPEIVAPVLVETAVYEMRRWIALKLLGFSGLRMISEDLDHVWHSFILFTEEYQRFCANAAGRFIHHYPKHAEPELQAAFISEFCEAYSSVFGSVPTVWLRRANKDCC